MRQCEWQKETLQSQSKHPVPRRWLASGRRRHFLPATQTVQRTRSNPCWTGPTVASCPKEKRDSNPCTRPVGERFIKLIINEVQTLLIPDNSCSCLSLQTETLWSTTCLKCPCQTISPAPRGPESACVRTRLLPRSPTAEVRDQGMTCFIRRIFVLDSALSDYQNQCFSFSSDILKKAQLWYNM